MGALESFFGLLMILGVLALYILPWGNAYSRGHHNAKAILVLNVFLGWTGIGWLAALIWSFTTPNRVPASPEDALRVCLKCGTVLKGLDLFCARCGAKSP